MANNKFDFHDIVVIFSANKKLVHFNGRTGVIRGISDSEEDATIYAYSVDILNEKGEVEFCKFIFEKDLRATGKKFDETQMYTGEFVKVRVDPKTGEGELVNDD
jgi:hypothetical protein